MYLPLINKPRIKYSIVDGFRVIYVQKIYYNTGSIFVYDCVGNIWTSVKWTSINITVDVSIRDRTDLFSRVSSRPLIDAL